MRTLKTTALVTLAALGLTSLITWRAAGSASPSPPGATSSPQAPSAQRASAGQTRRSTGLPERAFLPGSVYSYAINRSFALKGANGAMGLSTVASGTLEIAVAGAFDEGIALRVVLRSPTLVDQPTRAADTREGLETPFFALLRADGSLASVRFERAVKGEARRILQTMIEALQIVTGPRGELHFQTIERDASGELEVETDITSGSSLTRAKKRYLRVESAEGLKPIAEVGRYDVEGTSALTVDGSGWPKTVEESETVTSSFGEATIAATAHTVARLEGTRREPALIGSFERARGDLDPRSTAAADFAAARKNAAKSLVGGAGYRELAKGLGSEDKRSRRRAVARLGALFGQDPTAVAEARAALLAGAAGPAAGAIAGALGSAGTPDAQRALGEVLSSSAIAAETRTQAAVALGLTAQPIDEARAALAEAARSDDAALASAATLAQGSLIKHANEAGSTAVADVIASLIARLEAATTAEEQVLCLDALGNSGDPRALPPVLSRTLSPTTEVRRAAVEALRFQKGGDAQAAIALALSDLDPSVRRAALRAVAFQSVAPYLGALDGVLRHDSETAVRLDVVRILGRVVDTLPPVAELLSWSVAHDPAVEVRDAATAALSHP